MLQIMRIASNSSSGKARSSSTVVRRPVVPFFAFFSSFLRSLTSMSGRRMLRNSASRFGIGVGLLFAKYHKRLACVFMQWRIAWISVTVFCCQLLRTLSACVSIGRGWSWVFLGLGWGSQSGSCGSRVWLLCLFTATDSAVSRISFFTCVCWSTMLEKQVFMASCSMRFAVLISMALSSRGSGQKCSFFSRFSGADALFCHATVMAVMGSPMTSESCSWSRSDRTCCRQSSISVSTFALSTLLPCRSTVVL